MTERKVRTRFAPSPTGHVHIGNIRTAIFNWLYARHANGSFLLRIEDTDRERSTPEAVDAVFEALRWLGLDCDEEPTYQSMRRDAHLAAAERLLRAGQAYREDKGGTGRGECIVFRMPGTPIAFRDEIKGELRKESRDLPDFVIVRSNGTPVFHLSNVVDDMAMRVTHVIRGDDHIENTYRHVALYRALGGEPPRFAHLPMIVNAQGKPYSKRDGAAFVGEFRERGYLPEALLNFLALLGWSPGEDREIMSRGEMVRLFDLDRVKSGPAQMDFRKFEWMNGQYMAALPLERFVREARERLGPLAWARQADDGHFRAVCALMQSRTADYVRVEEWAYFFTDDWPCDEKAVRKHLRKPGMREALLDLRERLDRAVFSAESIERALRQTEQERGVPHGKLNQPVRVALTGCARGAGLYETAVLLGRERTLRRLRRGAELAGG